MSSPQSPGVDMAFISTTTPLLFQGGTTARVTCLAKRRRGNKRDNTSPKKGGAGGASAKSSLPDSEADLVRSFESEENVTRLRPSKKSKTKSKKIAKKPANLMTMETFDKEKVQMWVTRATWASLGVLVVWFVLVHTVIVGDWTGGGN